MFNFLIFFRNFLFFKLNFFLGACLTIIFAFGSFLEYSDNIGFQNIPLSQDEVDYSLAFKKGFLNNYLERDTLSFKSFINLSLLKAQNKNKELIEFSNLNIDEKDDLFILRHFHGVIPIYFWSLFNAEDPEVNQKNLRNSSLVLYFLFLISFFVFFYYQSDKTKEISALTIFTLTAFFTSLPFFIVNLSLNFHIFFALFSLYFAYELVNFIERGNNIFRLSFSISLMLATLETSIVILGIAFLIMAISSSTLYQGIINFIKVLCSSAMFLILIWPGVYISGAIVKSWFMYVYRIFIAGNEEYAGSDKLDVVLNAIKDLEIFFFFVILILFLMLINKKRFKQTHLIPVFLGFGYLIFIVNFSLNITYLIPAFALMVFGLVISFESYKKD